MSPALAAVPMFAGLEEAARTAVLARSRRIVVAAGRTLFHQGEAAAALFLVDEGRLKLSQLTERGDEVIVRFSGPGELFAAVAVLDGGDYPFTATAVDESVVRAWDRPALAAAFRDHPRLHANVLGIVGRHSREMLDRFREMATEPVPQRLARVLLRLAAASPSSPAAVRVTQQELADLAGTTLPTVSRTLTEWAQQGVVRAGRGRVALDAPDKLKAIAEGGPDRR